MYHKKKFTFLELMIAVIIFSIISVIIVTVFRTTIMAYKKGSSYTELFQSLSGTFLVMQRDLSKIVPIPDKDYVSFEPDNLAFIATNKTDKGYTALQLIKYEIKDNSLFRHSVKYPDDKHKIDDDPISFLEQIDKTSFSYMNEKSESNKGNKNLQSTNDNSNNGTNDQAKQAKQAKLGGSGESTKDDSDSEMKIPFAVGISGKIKNKKLEENFQTKLFFPKFVIEKSAKSDSGSKDDADTE